MKNQPISDIFLEKFLLHELDDEQMRKLQRQINEDPALKKRVEQLKESNREILSAYDPRQMAKAIHEKMNDVSSEQTQTRQAPKEKKADPASPLSTFKKNWKLFLTALTAASALSAASVAVHLAWFSTDTNRQIALNEIKQTTQGDIILKGEKAKLYIYRKKDNAIELLFNNSPAYEGDLVQIGYYVEKSCYGAIFSIDGRKNITLHTSLETQAEKLQEGKKILLNSSYELDDAPLYEMFFLVASEKPFDIQKTATRFVQKLARLKRPPQTSDFHIDKTIQIVAITLEKPGQLGDKK